MSSKLTFRARTLDSSRPLSIYRAADLPDLVDLNSINRAVPALPTGMEKEEEGEKHLQDILVAQGQGIVVDDNLVIPTPECITIQPNPEHEHSLSPNSQYHKTYTTEFKQPRQFIHVQPFGPNQDLPDYDMDQEDMKFFTEELKERRKLEVTRLTFEDMMDRLEKNSTQNVVTLKEAKLILKEDDDLILVVYDYWLNKRLATQLSLMPGIKTVISGTAQPHSPYLAFRRRTEKMQTRKNRKNEEASYEAMLKLRRDLSRAVTLLEMVKRREKTKKEKLNLTLDVFEKRHSMRDWDGKLLEAANMSRPKSAQSYNIHSWISMAGSPQPKKSYKLKRKHHRSGQRGYLGETQSNTSRHAPSPGLLEGSTVGGLADIRQAAASSEDETVCVGSEEEPDTDSPFTWRRREGVQYRAPLPDLGSAGEDSPGPPFTLASLNQGGTVRCIGYSRRRLGRGGRTVVDRISTRWDSVWEGRGGGRGDWQLDPALTRPITPPHLQDTDWDMSQEVPVRLEEGEGGPGLNNNRGFKMVDMNRTGAHNAAGALLDSHTVDIFSTAAAPASR